MWLSSPVSSARRPLTLFDDLSVEGDDFGLLRVEGAYLETHGHIKHVEVCADFIDFVPIAMTIPAIQAKGATVARVDAHLLTTKPIFLALGVFCAARISHISHKAVFGPTSPLRLESMMAWT